MLDDNFLNGGTHETLDDFSYALLRSYSPVRGARDGSASPRSTSAHQAQQHAVPVAATALVPAVKFDDDFDGLTRNREECNRGCIDN